MAAPSAVSSQRNAGAERRRRGGPRRSVEQMRKDAEALALHCQGKTYPQIAEKLEMKGRNRAYEAVKRALVDLQREKLEQTGAFADAIERIMLRLRVNQEIIDTPHYLAGRDGKIVMMTDPETGDRVPVLDDAPKQRAVTEMRHLDERLDKLMDVIPPTKSRVEYVPEDVVDREIKQLADEIAEAGRNTPVPKEGP